jgi:hypothetical protein
MNVYCSLFIYVYICIYIYIHMYKENVFLQKIVEEKIAANAKPSFDMDAWRKERERIRSSRQQVLFEFHLMLCSN